jgi:hypothetical protein
VRDFVPDIEKGAPRGFYVIASRQSISDKAAISGASESTRVAGARYAAVSAERFISIARRRPQGRIKKAHQFDTLI